MKRKKFSLVFFTMLVVGIGSFSLVMSITEMKGSVQAELSENTQIEETVETEAIEKISFPSGTDKSIVLAKETSDYKLNEITETVFLYQGQHVTIEDSLVDKDTAIENATKIMDFIYGYVDKTILEPYEIDKTEYRYEIQRQYKMQNGVNYGVFLKQEDDIICTIGIRLEEEPVLRAFARDGLIELAGGSIDIPEAYMEQHWCETTEKREAIYADYLNASKEIIAMLGLAPIIEEVKDVDCISYFSVGDTWSTVCFGYVLEDGTYVKVFYNRINGMWDGFAIAGYHQDYVDTVTFTDNQ